MYSGTMGRTDEQREGVGGGRGRGVGALQAALSVLLCPALSLPYCQALITRSISTVQTFQDSANRSTHYDNS